MNKPITVPIYHKGAQVGSASLTSDMNNYLCELMKEKFKDLNCQPFVVTTVFKSDIKQIAMTLVSLEIYTDMNDYNYFNKKEMDWLQKWFTEVRDCVGDFDYYKGDTMTPEEWDAFKEKIT